MAESKKKSIILWTMLGLSVVGFTDAVYLAIKAMVGGPVVCYAFNGCDSVMQSNFSKLFGVPVSMFGAVFYAMMIIAITYILQYRRKWAFVLAVYGALFGGLFSLYLLALQAFVINAWCFYCVISGTIGFVNAMLSIYLVKLLART